ncbi:hypothetical protein DRO61_09550 [Candidatus Bathyarchaeota archaeon]|nr:MAG: hypothetical protein DRO61_09550 [Candidatus Bathyarchaeota archaeon]
MSEVKQQIPKWFKGMIYDKGEEVVNPFSNESYELNAIELSIYDFIMDCAWVFERAPKTVTEKQVRDFHRALNWFRNNNSEAYMVLLD